MRDVVSGRILEKLELGKYARWAQRLTPESLEVLLWVVAVVGREYNEAKSRTGKYPVPAFGTSGMAVDRMRPALERIAAIQAGAGVEPRDRVIGEWFANPGSAFSAAFRARLAAGDPGVSWAAGLDELQLWELLWEVGSYGVRANFMKDEQGVLHPPPRFEVPAASERLMRNALLVLAALERGGAMGLPEARRQVLGEAS